jgi:hypothetical protein
MTAEAKSTIIFDIDGVIADNTDRLYELKKDRHTDPNWFPDWGKFYTHEMLLTDPEIPGVPEMVRSLYPHYRIVLLSNRFETNRPPTEQWLEEHNVPYDELLLRSGDHYNDSKGNHLDRLLAEGENILWAIDDDPYHKDVFESRGIPLVYFHSGYYEGERIDDKHLYDNNQGEPNVGTSVQQGRFEAQAPQALDLISGTNGGAHAGS